MVLSTKAENFAQNQEDAQKQHATIDNHIEAEMKTLGIPGLVAGIFKEGKGLFVKGYGLADVGLSIPMDPKIAFHIGSIGKSFVSAAIMMLVEEGRIGLEDSIATYFKDAERWEHIRIKNLLSHTSGLPEYMDGEVDYSDRTIPFSGLLNYTDEELVSKIKTLPTEFDAGERFSYCNTNYMLLGEIIQKLTGRPYLDLLSDRIFKPLGMESIGLEKRNDVTFSRPSGYELYHGILRDAKPFSDAFTPTADGALYCNIFDLAKWDAALYGDVLLKPSSLDSTFTVFRLNDGKPNEDGYGFGWFIKEEEGHRLIEHTGNWAGFTSVISRYVDEKLAVIVLCNVDLDASGRLADIAHAIAGFVRDM